MSNNIFASLRRRMTVMYALVFGLVSLTIVALTCSLVWLGVMQLEKSALLETAELAGAEYLAAAADEHSSPDHRNKGQGMGHRMQQGMGRSSMPGRHQPLPSANKNFIRILLTPQGAELLDKERATEAEPLLQNRACWPAQPKDTCHFTLTADGTELHYLGASIALKDNDQLYVFKDMSGYYALAGSLFSLLAFLVLLLLGLAILLSWWLAGKNLAPVEEMYLKQQQFTSDASHELRTPLNVLSLAVRGLKEDTDSSLSPFAAKNLTIMEEESSRLAKLTEELLLLTRSDSGRLENNFTAVDFSALCQSVLDKLILPAAEKDILLAGELEKNIMLQGDESSLQRLLIILLDNAIKYSPEGCDVKISLTSGQQDICLTVADNGPGIKEEEKKHVTDRFYRGDKARSREGGSGLGLALAKAILSQHQGRLEILDNLPCGTVMKVSLPKNK